jgi:hypothetical protein
VGHERQREELDLGRLERLPELQDGAVPRALRAPERRLAQRHPEQRQHEATAGALGLVPTWQTAPLTNNSDRQIITSCLLAHTNANGTSVQVSFRGNIAPIDHVNLQEKNATPYYEGTFYGNIFVDPNRVYVCEGDHPDNPRTGRSCTEATSVCRINRTGLCSDVCAPRVSPGYHPSCTGWGANYYFPISTWNSTL